MATSPVFTSTIGQSFVYIPLFFSRRIRATSSIEEAYCAAFRIRFDIGVPSTFHGVCATVVSPMRIPAAFM